MIIRVPSEAPRYVPTEERFVLRYIMTNDPVHLMPRELDALHELIRSGNEKRFYDWTKWGIERDYVMRCDRHECQQCKRRGRYRRATIVHHIKHLKDRPDLALCMYDPDTGERQLESVCKICHEEDHPEWQRMIQNSQKFTTEERWD